MKRLIIALLVIAAVGYFIEGKASNIVKAGHLAKLEALQAI